MSSSRCCLRICSSRLRLWLTTCHTLRLNAIDGIKANKENCLFFVERSVSPITAFAPHIGYANASRIAKQALIEKPHAARGAAGKRIDY